MNDSKPIQPAQRTPISPRTEPAIWRAQKKSPEDYERDRTGKYAKYFQGNNILPISEFVEVIEPKTLSLVISDLQTRRLTSLKREGFEEHIKITGIQCRYFGRGDGKACAGQHSHQALQITAGIHRDPKNKGQDLTQGQ